MIFTFEIPGRLSGMNEVVDAARCNRFAAASLKKKETNLCAQYVVANNVPRFKNPVHISLEWIEPNSRRDIDNISGGGTKPILDALVETERLPDDSRLWVKSISHLFPTPNKDNPRIRVTIEEVA